MATIVKYNGVILYNVHTREWIQEVRYDDSRTDAIFHTFRLRFEGILHAGADGTVWISSGASGSELANYRDAEARLLQVRRTLIVWISDETGNTEEYFRCEPADGSDSSIGDIDRDVDNGPKPRAFRVLQIIGSKAMRVSFEVDCAKLVCGQGAYAAALPVVLNNRWTVAEDMDENQFLTRTIAGRMRLSTAVAASRIDGRSLVVPGLETGFRRVGLDFSIDKTGLEAEYRVTDRQVHTAAPWPATKMSARHAQSTNDGLNMTSEVHVDLEGPPYADKQLLLLRAIDIIDSKLNFSKIKADYKTRYFPENITIVDHIGTANRVEATVRFLQTPETAESIGTMFGNLRKDIGQPLKLPAVAGQPWQYNPARSTPPAIYGYTPPEGTAKSGTYRSPMITFLLQCYLQHPCVDVHGIAKVQQFPASGPPAVTQYPAGRLKATYQAQLKAYEPDDWSDSAKTRLYTLSRSCSRFQTDKLRVQLPIAAEESETPQDTSKVFALGLGQCRRMIDVDMERLGAWPEVPAPDDTYTDGELTGTLLNFWIEPHPPTLSGDGIRLIYRLTAHYVYALNRPPTTQEKMRVGAAPQTKYTAKDLLAMFDPTIAFANEDIKP